MKSRCGTQHCLQIVWQMFHSKKRAIIMPDIVKQISATIDNAPCESKRIYPTAVLLDLCSTAFHRDHSLVDVHLRSLVAAFCARAKVAFPTFLPRVYAQFCARLFFVELASAFVLPRVHTACSCPFQVSNPSSEEQLHTIWASFTQAKTCSAITLSLFLSHYSDFADLLLLCISSATRPPQRRPAAL
jgi:hypothetical protein